MPHLQSEGFPFPELVPNVSFEMLVLLLQNLCAAFKQETILEYKYVRFEIFTAVTMKNGVFWDFIRATRRNVPEDALLLRM
jgi:hypothetical protein